MRNLLIPLLMVFVLAGCATPNTEVPEVEDVARKLEEQKQHLFVFKNRDAQRQRFLNISLPLMKSAGDLCETHQPEWGIRIWHDKMISEGVRSAIKREYDVGPYLSIRDVFSGFPAEKVGVKRGDVLLKVNDWALPADQSDLKMILAKLDETLKKNKNGDVELVVQRGEERKRFFISPDAICDYKLVLDFKDQERNAFTDGERIVVTLPFMEFFQDDDELASVISHEMAHAIMGHVEAKQRNATLAAAPAFLAEMALIFLGGVNTGGDLTRAAAAMGANAYSVDFEKEADYVGMYVYARTGRPLEKMPDAFRRIGLMSPRSIAGEETTHPTSAKRFVALQKTLEEVKNKKKQGLPLLPNMKDGEIAPGQKEDKESQAP
ncbi:MAG: M48 family metalloprotease [Magnetococcales bacterium]|nr:M48 family metalloprotease [Magnetococcales bacterium]